MNIEPTEESQSEPIKAKYEIFLNENAYFNFGKTDRGLWNLRKVLTDFEPGGDGFKLLTGEEVTVSGESFAPGLVSVVELLRIIDRQPVPGAILAVKGFATIHAHKWARNLIFEIIEAYALNCGYVSVSIEDCNPLIK